MVCRWSWGKYVRGWRRKGLLWVEGWMMGTMCQILSINAFYKYSSIWCEWINRCVVFCVCMLCVHVEGSVSYCVGGSSSESWRKSMGPATGGSGGGGTRLSPPSNNRLKSNISFQKHLPCYPWLPREHLVYVLHLSALQALPLTSCLEFCFNMSG